MREDQTLTLAQAQTREDEAARRIQEAVARSLEASAKRAEEAAARAEADVQAAAQAGAQGEAVTVPAEPGTVFRVGPGGQLIEVVPGDAPPPGEGSEAIISMPPGPPPDVHFAPEIPKEAVAMVIAFFAMIAIIIVGLPIARAVARRMDRSAATPRASAEQAEQLRHIQTAVDAMAVEVERISENQRYVTRLLAEGSPLGTSRFDQPSRVGAPLEAPGERR